ncbi:hypothetical protein [Tuwongella immobilis]|uniref:Uncharacterized protein n=1 Tax=Tuwongella immobilis TaxID=692036 RepID=A0A6C2YT57_9BACT|nr:hypothetical protein [Tuwongella immobilis]VIP04646.1 Uncharacterized protein OS=Blastopirellula marina DSM 3645 GN=DSM3645_00975 PE=4 SV=1 [Tuwongella immobilis]VTS06653.1 Uncharacterized protein OS=Blastopirellula marina DSM 3645 GN=DSM3645_00975 PE=4 SV=1 [Tuwongella immobilis]
MLFAQDALKQSSELLNEGSEKLKELTGSSFDLAVLIFGVLVVGVGALILRRFLYRREVMPDLQKGLREDLREYPPAPPAGSRTLHYQNEPTRLRLVVVAPQGKNGEPITADDVPALLDEVCRGLGAMVRLDKPRIKVWPPQLSIPGFAPTFHRLITTGDDAKSPTKWILTAGPAKAGKRPILLAMALKADDAMERDLEIVTQPAEWNDRLRIVSE